MFRKIKKKYFLLFVLLIPIIYYFFDFYIPPICGNIYTHARIKDMNNISYKEFGTFMTDRGYSLQVMTPEQIAENQGFNIELILVGARKVHNYILWRPEAYISMNNRREITISVTSKSGPVFNSRLINKYLVNTFIAKANNRFPAANFQKNEILQYRPCS